jgi:hypothetical protein
MTIGSFPIRSIVADRPDLGSEIACLPEITGLFAGNSDGKSPMDGAELARIRVPGIPEFGAGGWQFQHDKRLADRRPG